MCITVRFLSYLLFLPTVFAFVPSLPSTFVTAASSYDAMSSSASSTSCNAAAGPEIQVIRQPDQEFLEKKGVFDWGTWGCSASKFDWTYDQTESCYLLAGKVTVTPNDGRASATFGKGDFVTFPAGMSCVWDVQEAVKKHYMFY